MMLPMETLSYKITLHTYLRAELIRGRCSKGVISAAMTKASDMTEPPPKPLMARPAIKAFMVGASAQIKDPMLKKDWPNSMMGLRPKISTNYI